MSDYIIGRNPVMEAIRAGHSIDKIYIKDGEVQGSLKQITGAASQNGIAVMRVSKQRLDQMAEGNNHQGIIAVAAAYDYCEVDDILSRAKDAGEPPFIVICEKLTDPHNLGSIIRTSAGAGVHGIIISKHDSVGLNSTVAKVAAGAAEFMPVARVTNIASVMDGLKEDGIWITGADISGDRSLYEADLKGAVAIVIGSEGKGMSRLVKEKCDFLVKIPMRDKLESLNASVAAALMIYEAARSRF
ncbi:MAG: 23S rRNA (guanosine(2251)-2'-O)-methyltransferase RlmB [Clostridia bacterium]|nr:23S rRNA (guanosine(2251)-2'-O)-methyltransferase RlmB [Clostridia bacterium]